MNRWNIPTSLEQEVIERDKSCVYCGVAFGAENRPSWEHIVNDARIITRENITLCCRACNSSKGVKPLESGWSPHIANDWASIGKLLQKWSRTRFAPKSRYTHISDTTRPRFLTDL